MRFGTNRKVSPQRTFRRWNYAACSLFVCGLVLAFVVHPFAGALLVFAAFLTYLVAIYKVRCLHCGKHLLWRSAGRSAGHVSFPAHCPQCGVSTSEGQREYTDA